MSQKYRLTTLGWYNFERLVQTLLKAVIGPGVTSFGGSKDGGRDATFEGKAEYPSKSTQWSGYWVFQVKFIDYEVFAPDGAQNRVRNDLRREIDTIIDKNRKKPDNYILVTNISLTADNRDKLDNIASNCGCIGNFSTIDGEEICQFLDDCPNIRRSFPQLLGLADLDLLINSEIYGRSRAYYNEWSPVIGKFVETDAYFKAVSSLNYHHFVVIDGPPEAGKSMIAAACAFVHATEGYAIYIIDNPNDLFRIRYSNENEKQLYIADDAVGSLTFNPGLTDEWGRDFSRIYKFLNKSHKLIWTSRSYILREAIHQSRIGENINNFPGIHEILVLVSDLTKFQKAEILYNHAKVGNLNESAKNIIKDSAVKIVSHANFTPERIRQLVNDFIPSFYEKNSSQGELNWNKINQFLNNPSNHWEKAYDKLDFSEKLLLSSMLDFESYCKLDELKIAYGRRISEYEGKSLNFDDCLGRLNQSFLKVEEYSYYGKVVLFQHPSLRDLLLLKIQQDDNTLLKHIEIASPKAISEIIWGFGNKYTEEENIEHLISIKNEEQFKKLLSRIDDLNQMTLSESDWSSILSSLDVLITYNGSIKHISSEKFDFIKFSKTKKGNIISHVLSSFCSMKTYENCRNHSVLSWFDKLNKFYSLSHFITPPPRIEYLSEIQNIIGKNGSEETEFDFILLMAEYEPIYYKQIKSEERIGAIGEYIQSTLDEKIEDGKELEDSDPDYVSDIDYDEWYSESDNIHAFATTFYKFTHIDEMDSKINELGDLMESVEQPEECYESDLDYEDGSDKEYWTIQKIFEDL